jgi:hypothetical protein
MDKVTNWLKAGCLTASLLLVSFPSESANLESLENISKKLAAELVEFLTEEDNVAMVRPDLSAVGLEPFEAEVVTQQIEMALERELTDWDFVLIDQSAFQAWIDYSSGPTSNPFDPRTQVEAAKDARIDALLVTRITNVGDAYRVYVDALDIHDDGAGIFKTKSYMFSANAFMKENVVVDRRRGVIWAKGIGYPNKTFPKPLWNKHAETAAIIDAKSKLAHLVADGKLTSETVVRNNQFISDEKRTRLVTTLPKAHQVGRTVYNKDGLAEVVVQMQLDR